MRALSLALACCALLACAEDEPATADGETPAPHTDAGAALDADIEY